MKELEVSNAPIEITDTLKIALPIELVKYLKLRKKDKEVFFVLTNGIVQISSRKPHSHIPVFVKENHKFAVQQ